MGSKQNRIGFGVGERDGIRSSVWTVVAHGGDVYLFCEHFGGHSKLSLHESGHSHWKGPQSHASPDTTEVAPQLITKWKSTSVTPLSAAHVFRVMIPVSQLRDLGRPRSKRSVLWIMNPPAGGTVIYDFYKTPPMPYPATQANLPGKHLGSLPLNGGGWITVVVGAGTLDETVISELRRNVMANTDFRSASESSPKARGAGFMQGPDGFRGMVEIALH